MILQKEIIQKAQEWNVPPDTVDKDYILGHFLSVFVGHYKDDLVFKGGTCLRKCYFENYRFSEDLDFTALDKEGYQVNIKYWGANHSKNQRPLPSKRWHTKIKLEISIDELLLLDTQARAIIHPYSDMLTGEKKINCYSINEVVGEKLRALKQRSYTAPRDFYDLFHLTEKFSKKDWETIIPIFLKKMEHKNLVYQSPEDLIDESKLINVKRAWKTSVAHQIPEGHQSEGDEIIETVVERIKAYL